MLCICACLSPPCSSAELLFSQPHPQQKQQVMAFSWKTAARNSLCTNIQFRIQDCSFTEGAYECGPFEMWLTAVKIVMYSMPFLDTIVKTRYYLWTEIIQSGLYLYSTSAYDIPISFSDWGKKSSWKSLLHIVVSPKWKPDALKKKTLNQSITECKW